LDKIIIMSISRIVKLNKKGQLVIPQEIRKEMGLLPEKNLVIFTRGQETVILTPEKYTSYTCDLMKGTWASTKKDVEDYLFKERKSWE